MSAEYEQEVLEALRAMDAGKDFLLTGGAGSGKTFSMVTTLDHIFAEDPNARIACLTFTNVAVNEIRSRFQRSGMHVSTIHEFLWPTISRYKKNLRESLAELVNRSDIKSALQLPVDRSFWVDGIQYKDWINLEAGEVSHSEVVKLAKHMFEHYAPLGKILADSYDYIFIDEYQDSPVEFLEILLDMLPSPTARTLRIGLFGDGEQAIHEGRAGKAVIDKAVADGRMKSITKIHNRRNPTSVIRVINNLRVDGLTQVSAEDQAAPNFGVTGTARFIYTTSSILSTESLVGLEFCRDWDLRSEKTKLLYLGKSMIAKEQKFPKLMEIYDKDRVVEYAKRIKKRLDEDGIALDEEKSLDAVLSIYGNRITPTPTQKRAFEADPEHLGFARSYRFTDLATTSVNADKLLGTKKVSEFDDRDRGEKRDALINHLIAIHTVIDLYRKKKFSQLIRLIDISIENIEKRNEVYSNLEKLTSLASGSIGDVIRFADVSGLLKRSDPVLLFESKHPYRYSRVLDVSYMELANVFDYVEDHSPFSTQHGVKGSEWDNIFVSLDNGGWNNYNFGKLFADPTSMSSVEDRSRMMLYVTCSRAMKNLVVYAHEPSESTLSRAREWFGSDDVVCVDIDA